MFSAQGLMIIVPKQGFADIQEWNAFNLEIAKYSKQAAVKAR